MRLRPIQQQCLEAAADAGGLVAHVGVGCGKTLICALLPEALRATRPLLLVPGGALRQTLALRDEYRAGPCEVWSYERLSHPMHHDDLDALQPDALILDEAHRAVGDSARRRRLARYIAAHRPRVAVLSGTLLRPGAIAGACELAHWALGSRSPLPRHGRGLQSYLEGTARGGELHRWARELGIESPLERLRLRVAGARGCVVSPGVSYDGPIRLEMIPWPVLPEVGVLEATWELPGLVLVEATHVAEVRRQLHCGYYYRWAHEPSRAWLDARRAWAAAVRGALCDEHDSEGRIAAACARGEAPTDEAREAWAVWQWLRSTPEPPTEAVWIDDGLIRDAAARGAQLTWYAHQVEAERLGLPIAPKGKAPAPGPWACSVHSHATGLNLQWASTQVLLAPPRSDELWEQLLGRTHRAEQTADEVTATVYVSGAVWRDIDNAVTDAARSERLTGAPQRLLWAIGRE